MRVYYDRDADLNLIKTKKVVHRRLRQPGPRPRAEPADQRRQGCRRCLAPGLGQRARRPKADGLKVMDVAEAAGWADVIMMLTPDELQADIYKDSADNIRDGAAIAFAHG